MNNPVLNQNTFVNYNAAVNNDTTMTLEGTIYKSVFLLLLVCLSGVYTWGQFTAENMQIVNLLMTIGVVIGGILGFVIAFVKKTAPYLSPVYALAEGCFLGGLSAMFEAEMPGIVFQAVTVSLAVMFAMLILFRSRMIVVTDKLRAGILIATLSIVLIYLVSFILSLFGKTVPYIHQAGIVGILFSLLVIGVAAFNFLLDFDIIERGVSSFAPKYFEWYASFGLLVTLVWLYVEILKLLAKLRRK